VSRPLGHQKVDLRSALELVAGTEHHNARSLIRVLCNRFSCNERAAADALSILVRGRWLEQSRSDKDGRESTYVLTERGRSLLTHPRGALVLRNARKLFTTCASPRTKRRQDSLGYHGADIELQRLEQLLLTRT
jgi:DNA-binding MarR family transcriptional regulator